VPCLYAIIALGEIAIKTIAGRAASGTTAVNEFIAEDVLDAPSTGTGTTFYGSLFFLVHDLCVEHKRFFHNSRGFYSLKKQQKLLVIE
jgi:hypothetical protein